MRSSSSGYVSLAAAMVLLLVLTEAQGIRLDAETRASVRSSSSSNPVHNKPSDDAAKGSSTSSVSESETTTRSAGAVKEARAVAAHGLPEFHEDYYVRTAHSSRHH